MSILVSYFVQSKPRHPTLVAVRQGLCGVPNFGKGKEIMLEKIL
jgi:hypothetical protein